MLEDHNFDDDSDDLLDNNYEKAYHILMDYFDELSEESRIELDEKLKELGLRYLENFMIRHQEKNTNVMFVVKK